MNEAAYGKRKQYSGRKIISFCLKIISILGDKFSKDKNIKSILVYPAITDQKEFTSIVNKLSWAYCEDVNISISVLKSENIFFDYSLIEAEQALYYNQENSNIKFISECQRQNNWHYDHILINKFRFLFNLNILLRIKKVSIIDETFYSTTEAKFLQLAYYDVMPRKMKDYYRDISRKNMYSLEKKYKNIDKAYCFVTGPSFDQYKNFLYDDNSFKIICNSIVKNNDFLEYIVKPDLLVFADPVFHFSPCLYSEEFRKEVINVKTKFNCYIAVPEKTIPLLISHYPELEKNLIGISGKPSLFKSIFKIKDNKFIFPTSNNLFVRGSSNILTFLMVPFASSIAKKIYIIGADGREKSEKYFWKHSSNVQFDDLMETVFNTHPSFFRDRNYEDYYEVHCSFLNDLIQYGESEGKQYYSLTKSFIPALHTREVGNNE